MERVKEKIYNKLKDIVKVVSTIKIEYKYIGATKEHFIKVCPRDEFKSNEIYLEMEADLLLEFAEDFPYDSLVFLTENDNLDIDYPEKVFVGELYNSSLYIKTFSSLIKNNSVIDFDVVPSNNSNFNFKRNLTQIKETSYLSSINDLLFGSFIESGCEEVCCDENICVGEINFSIAA